MFLTTIANDLRRIRTTNATDLELAPAPPLTATPSGQGILDLRGGAPNQIWCQFFGAGTPGSTATCRITRYSRIAGGSLWAPCPLAVLTLTLGKEPGGGSAVPDVLMTERWVNVIAETQFTAAREIIQPEVAEQSQAAYVLDPKGAQFVRFDFAKGTMTSVNGLVGGL